MKSFFIGECYVPRVHIKTHLRMFWQIHHHYNLTATTSYTLVTTNIKRSLQGSGLFPNKFICFLKSEQGWACRHGASCLRWHCLGPDPGAGVVMAAGVRGVCLGVKLQTHTHARTLMRTLSVRNILHCRIINRRQQKAAPLSLSPAPMGPYHFHLPLHSFLLNTCPPLLCHTASLTQSPLSSPVPLNSHRMALFAICLSP